MMKKIFFIAALLISISSFSQRIGWQDLYNNPYYHNPIKVSELYFQSRDTLATSNADTASTFIYSLNDTAFYIHLKDGTNRRFDLASGIVGSTDTSHLSARINLKVDSITTNTDSSKLFYWVNGTSHEFYDVKNILAGGDSTVFTFPDYLDSTENPQGRNLASDGQGHIFSSPKWLFDSAHSVVALGYKNISVFGLSTKFKVNGAVRFNGLSTATGFATPTGTSTEFLKADGSVDPSTYLTSYTETDPLALKISNNLSDVTSASTARTNLGLGSFATLSNPATTNGDLLYWNGSAYVRLGVGTSKQTLHGGTVPQWLDTTANAGGSSGWSLTGNSGTSSTNFLGTTDNVSMRFRTNNIERMILDSIGYLHLGDSLYKSDNFSIYGRDSATIRLSTNNDKIASVKYYESENVAPGNFGFITEFQGSGNQFFIASINGGVRTNRVTIPQSGSITFSSGASFGGDVSVTGKGTFSSTLTAPKFYLNSDLGLHPVGGGQSIVQSWNALQLAGNTRVVPGSFTPVGVGINQQSYHVVIPMFQTNLSGNPVAGLAILGVSGQEGNYFEITTSTNKTSAANRGDVFKIGADNTATFGGSANFSKAIYLSQSSSASSTLTLTTSSSYWTATGTTSTWTLPDLATSQGIIYYIDNEGSGTLTINTAGSDNIRDAGSTSNTTSVTVASGATCVIFAQTSNWKKRN